MPLQPEKIGAAFRSEPPASCTDVFLGFLEIGLFGFGGVAAIARHVIVEKRRWLSDDDYAAVLAVGQALPGGNVLNASVMIGDRFQGPLGAIAALMGLIATPIALLIGLSLIYERWASVPLVRAAMIGAGAAAAGVVLGTGLRMARRLRSSLANYVIAALTFAAIGLLRLPLAPCVLAAAALSIAVALLSRRS
ncbi:MAG TPA: chromate transporter [Beijerinckiaceae bacterium]|nr:chromate transporter [Beijerinckiaceae bacterium]